MVTLAIRDVVTDRDETLLLRERFRERHHLLLEGLLDASILDLLRPRLEAGPWQSFEHGGIGREALLADPYALNLLHFAINAPAFLEAVRTIADCDEITWFDGRVFTMDPRADHFDSWHDDFTDGRLVGMSVNLTFGGFEGGEFEMREIATGKVLGRIANHVLGNASLFRIDQRFQHRVAPIAGHRPRTAFAGWFKAGKPGLLNRLKTDAHFD